MNGKQVAIMIFALSLILTPAYSRAFDGETSATESVCDGLKGGTPGLHGLCVAYCDSTDRDHPFAAWLLRIYNKRRAPLDPMMPCICPCFNEEQILAANANDQGYTDPVSSCRLEDQTDQFTVTEEGGVCVMKPFIEFLLDGSDCERNIVNGTAGLGECPSNNLPVGSIRLRIFDLNDRQKQDCSELIRNVCQE